MSDRALLLGLDAGTSSIKAALFNTGGDVIAVGSAPVPTSRPRPGWVEQDPDDIWGATVTAVRAALATANAKPEEVLGVAACGNSPTLILLDSDGRPVRPAIVWQDTRAGDAARAVAARLGDRWVDAMGARFPVNHSFSTGRLLWLRKNEPDALDRADKAIEPKDYLHFRLTGVVGTDVWAAKGLANLRTGRFIEELGEIAGVSADLLPTIRQPHEVVGFVRAAAAAQLGLRAGTPVATGWTDGICTLLGTGVYGASGAAFLSSGTSDVVGNITPGPAAGGRRVLEAPAPGNQRVSMAQSQSGGASLVWFADAFCDGRVDRALALAERAEPGAGGLLFLPYLQGERAPIWDDRARGVFFGISTGHGLPEFARAVLEGVALCDRHLTEALEENTGVRVERLRPAGGVWDGLWGRIRADVLGRPLELTSEQPATLGAAMLAGVAAGVWPDLAEATAATVRVTGRIEPDAAKGALYGALFGKYVALYPRVRDLY